VSSAADLNPLIDSIQDAGLGRRRWNDVLRVVADGIGAQCVTLEIRAYGSDWSMGNWSGIDPPFRRAYEDRYLSIDPMAAFTATCRPGTIVTDPMIVPLSVLERTEFY
jgi:hypothetical protein